MNIMPATAVRGQFRQALEQTEKEPVFITQFGRPKAVLLAFDAYERVMEALEDRQDRKIVGEAIAKLRAAGSPAAAGFVRWDEASRDP